jgi:hypothetical protein
MARGREGRDPKGPYCDLATIAERQALVCKRQILSLRQHVDGPKLAGQSQAPAHIVVVDVGLQHVGDGDTEGLGRSYVTLRLALGVDDDGDIAIMYQVAAVPQTFSIKGDGFDPNVGAKPGKGSGRGNIHHLDSIGRIY